jgi:hypothetical protein
VQEKIQKGCCVPTFKKPFSQKGTGNILENYPGFNREALKQGNRAIQQSRLDVPLKE